jgi:hypothetical protein
MTDEEKTAEIHRKMAEIVAEAHRLAAESEAVLAQMEGGPAIISGLNVPHFKPQLRLIQGGKR